MRIEQVDWEHPASIDLRAAQRAEIAERYGTPDSEPGPAPTAADITAFFVALADDGTPLGCGGLRELSPTAAEIKRMFVDPAHRGSGVSSAVLARIEREARDRGYQRLLLETGTAQPDAVRFYTREGYRRIPNFGHYTDAEASLCFAKPVVRLDQWTADSLELLERSNVPAMMTHLGGPETAEQLVTRHERYLGYWSTDPQGAWTFRIMWAGEAIGGLSYWRLEPEEFEIGWAVVPEYQGRGLARAAVEAAIDDMRRRGHHGLLHATPSVENAASNALAKSLGFTLAEVVEIEYPPGHPMTANDWVLRVA